MSKYHLEMETVEDVVDAVDDYSVSYFRSIHRSAHRMADLIGHLPEDTPLTDDEMEMFKSCQTYMDFRFCCDFIKARRAEGYPPDWHNKMRVSGLYDEIMERIGVKPTEESQ